MPPAKRPRKRPRLIHIPVNLRVSVDPDRWTELYGDEGRPAIADKVRRLAVSLVQESAAAREGAIVSSRRAGL